MLIKAQLYFFYFIAYSFLGWGYETAVCSVKAGHLVNRGFLNGPYCPIYGAGAIIFLLLLKNQKSYVSIFVFGALIACAVEYATSYVMEKLFDARWWDYSKYKFNLNGRICLGAAIIFGAFAVFLLKFAHPYVEKWTLQINRSVFNALTTVMLIVFIADIVISVRSMRGINEKLVEFTNMMSAYLGGDAFEKSGHMLNLPPISRQQRRIIRAFPKMRSIKYEPALQKIRPLLNKKGKKY